MRGADPQLDILQARLSFGLAGGRRLRPWWKRPWRRCRAMRMPPCCWRGCMAKAIWRRRTFAAPGASRQSALRHARHEVGREPDPQPLRRRGPAPAGSLCICPAGCCRPIRAVPNCMPRRSGPPSCAALTTTAWRPPAAWRTWSALDRRWRDCRTALRAWQCAQHAGPAGHRRVASRLGAAGGARDHPATLPPAPALATGRKLRIGFMSSDLRDHPVTYFALPLLEQYDRNQVEVFSAILSTSVSATRCRRISSSRSPASAGGRAVTRQRSPPGSPRMGSTCCSSWAARRR